MHRPAPATVISLIALFFAMSGTAVAATGGNLILGKPNTATAVTSLSNSKGTALSLSSTSTTPPLTVSNSVQVPKLNASELDGQPASAFLGANGTAANASELGGTPASGFIQGGGTISDGRLGLASGEEKLISAPGSQINASCTPSGDNSLYLYNTQEFGETVTVWRSDGGGAGQLNLVGGPAVLDPTTPTTAVIVVQVDTGSSISTYTVTEAPPNANVSVCYFTGQVINSNQ